MPWINVFRRVDPVGNTLNEGGSKGQFVVSRYFSYPTGQPPATIPPPPPFPDFALGGTARAGLDYTATKQATTVVLPPLGSSMTFIDGYEVEISPLEDNVYDGGEWVDFALIPNEQSIVPSSSKGVISVTLPISDAGTPPKPQISIVAPDPNASELATSSGMYRIMRNDVNLPQSLTINYAFDETGLTDPATFSDDYTITSKVGGLSSSGSITFPAGVAMIEVKLTPVDDSKLENDELAQLTLLSGSAYVVDATKSKAQVLIVDKESIGVKVCDVTFSGADLINIVADPGTPSYGSPPHWVDSDLNGIIDVPADRALPVGYPRNTNSVISAHFKIDNLATPNPGSSYSYKLRGTNANTAYQPYFYTIPATAVTLTGNDVYLPPTTIYNPFPNTVNYGALTINWEFSCNGGQTWKSAGQTANELYVTLATPADTSPVYHTLLYISIPISASVAAAVEATVISQTFKKFETLTITDKHIQPAFTGRPLHYYKEWTKKEIDTAAKLLLTRDGGCYGWAQLFADSLRAAGNNTPMKQAIFEPLGKYTTERERILVNNWDFVGNFTSGNAQYPYQNKSRYPDFPKEFMAKGAQDQWQYIWGNPTEVPDLIGLAGQNVAEPASLFVDHCVIKIGDVYYDPSYGKTFASKQEWEDQAVAGFIIFDEVGKRYLIRQNPTGPNIAADIQETLREYNGGPLPQTPP